MAGEASRSGAGTGAITGINVTPLVDITLVLLIIFMVTAKLIARHDALTLDLPKAVTGSEVQEVFSVAVPADGSLTLDGEAIADEALVDRARAALANNPELRAVLQADGAIPHRRVMQLLDLLRQAGLTRIAFGVVLEPADPVSSAGTGAGAHQTLFPGGATSPAGAADNPGGARPRAGAFTP